MSTNKNLTNSLKIMDSSSSGGYEKISNIPHFSALGAFNVIWFFIFLGFFILLLGLPYVFLHMSTAAMITVFVISFLPFILNLYKLVLSSIRIAAYIEDVVDFTHLDLPVYTVLVPLYGENEITINNLLQALQAINYDSEKLDVKLIVEENDNTTIELINKCQLPSYMNMLMVPNSDITTKPRACNYGLEFATGEFLTIYDAEDSPEPNQLLKAVHAFRENTDDVVCVQARLSFYNINDNWITKLFTLEYILWFKYILPVLSNLGLAIPLGGTSNHFKTKFLKFIGGWDAYNVTEDAALGVLIHLLGYKVKMFDSYTLEEANCQFINWIKQRTRWIKGHMQTYLVYMRSPSYIYKQLGFWQFCHFQIVMGGGAFVNLSYILSMFVTFLLLFFKSYFIAESIFTHDAFLIMLTISVLFQVLNLITLSIIIIRERLFKLIPIPFLMPVYYFMMSLAAYRAIYQLIFKPSYWDKTAHGISKIFKK